MWSLFQLGKFDTEGKQIATLCEKDGMCPSLARDEPVTPGVACLTAWIPIKGIPRFAKPDFRLGVPRF